MYMTPIQFPTRSRAALAASFLVALVLVGCAAPRSRAPVVDRGPSVASAPPPGIENAGKPGYYTVKPGDTLIRIGLETGQNWRDIQSWNSLSNPNLIEVGQVLRVAPPTMASAPAVVAPTATPAPGPVGASGPTAAAVPDGNVTARPLPGATGSTSSTAPAPAPAPAATAAVASGDEVSFIWPAQGTVVDTFDEARNKGVGIAGRLGEPVLAAADGRVVYAGAGLRGYGNLVILKHNNTYLTAYAHNQALLVREDQAVKQGQKIAEMGSSDTDRVKLHFEVRRQGKPVDPLTHLPRR